MIKVIEYHEPKFVYQWQCKNCNSIFQFEEEDCTESYDRSSRILEISCPVCGKVTWSADSWKKVRAEWRDNE